MSRSTTRNSKPGVMKMSVSRAPATSVSPEGAEKTAADSSARSVVVPAATMRPPAARVRAMAATAASPTSYHSLCILCSARVSLRTGWKVPAPTCSVICTRSTPRTASAASTASSKCSDAVGAATAPGRCANTVW